MARPDPGSQPSTYPIGVVARLTGIHPETLRIWERRYGLVEPQRTEGGGRLYSDQDVRRLSLVKRLVDAGNPVRLVAPLSVEALEARVGAMQAPGASAPRTEQPCRIAVLGETLPARLRQDAAALGALQVVAASNDGAALTGQSRSVDAAVLLIECETVQPETAAQVRSLVADAGAHNAVVVFGFGARPALRALEQTGVQCLQAPVTVAEIRRACLSARALHTDDAPAPEAVPARRFSPEQLARVAAMTPSIACECPHHLADLINSLAAFETYSAQCANRNPKDAQVHAALHATTAAARGLLEQALERVLAHEGIAL
jgi:hypothetical protein